MRWTSEQDNGWTDAVNKGIARSKGQVIGLLNADDFFPPWTIATVIENLMRHPEVDFTYGDVIVAPMHGRKANLWFNPRGIMDGLLHGWSDPTIFFRKGAYEALGGMNSSFGAASSTEFLVRAAKVFRFMRIREALIVFRIRPQSDSVVYLKENLRFLKKVKSAHELPDEGRVADILHMILQGRFQSSESLRLWMSAMKGGGYWNGLLSSQLISPRILGIQCLIDAFPLISLFSRKLNLSRFYGDWLNVKKVADLVRD